VKNTVFPIWVFVAMALLIALAAFGAAQLQEGAGMIVAGAGSMIWTAFVARKGAIMRGKNG
jgi:hypothetical protein